MVVVKVRIKLEIYNSCKKKYVDIFCGNITAMPDEMNCLNSNLNLAPQIVCFCTYYSIPD